MLLKRKIKVLIVDDSVFFRNVMTKELSKDPTIDVVGVAADAFDARDKILELEPDVLTLDVEMPKMNGIEFLKKLMPQYPIPVVVVSAVSGNVFDALDAGAVDFVTKPDTAKAESFNSFLQELIVKIKIASTAKVGHFKKKDTEIVSTLKGSTARANDIVIAIGASTGGTEAIYNTIKKFPRETPGIVIVQHMPPVFTKMYADRLNNSCHMEVKEAEDGDLVRPGLVLVAPGDKHMELRKESGKYKVACFKGEKVSGHCPSVDVLFQSVAKVAGSNAIGVILTGMGSDGAKGLLSMKNVGAYTVGQDEKSCVVYGMPMVAYNIGAVIRQSALENIPQIINDYLLAKK